MLYTAKVTGRDKRWTVTIPTLGTGEHLRVTYLADVAAAAKNLIVSTLDVAPSTVDVAVIVDDFAGISDVQLRSERIHKARGHIRDLQEGVQAETNALALELDDAGLSRRDIAYLLDLSPTWVKQIVKPDSDKEQGQTS
ncbi:hypothetical protein F5X71_34735 [Nocardia brasiliensis]|uniref:Antitoxin HicB n=1 Tax=Nocardia brasiliensis TaxID=37326 RepID=A0A6G9Y140_NOCBR|nr:hypothetical protein [Nocardia brasiliensis]QIS06783.1 hypothetical protein F5X71_34735 [Nocardia brasiliensis]